MIHRRPACLPLLLVVLLWLSAPVLGDPVTITGHVLGPDDQPVPHAQVLVKYRDPGDSLLTAQAASDATGNFSVSFDVGDPTKPVTVAAVKDGLAVAWKAAEPGDDVTIKLGADLVACAGTVTDPEGNPVVGADVWVRMVRRGRTDEGPGRLFVGSEERLWLGDESFLRDTTDAVGRYEITSLPPGTTVNIEAVAEGREFIIMFDPIPADSRDISIVLRREAVISGRITQDGEPVAGVKVSCFSRGRPPGHGSAVSAEDGTYEMAHLPPATYDAIFFPPEGLVARALEGVELKPGDHFTSGDAELIAGGLVQGTVVAADTGRPFPGASVSAYGPSRPEPCGRAEGTHADESGRYTLRLAPGRNKIFSHGMPGYPWSRVEPKQQWVEIVDGQTVTAVDVVLHPLLQVRGQVLLPDGQPAAGVGVGGIGIRYPQDYTGVPSLEFKASAFRGKTDDRGYFELQFERISGSFGWWLIAWAPQRGLAAQLAMPANRVAKEPIQMRLEDGAYLVASMVDTEGRPVPDVPVTISLSSDDRIHHGYLWGDRTDEQGRVRVGPLPPGLYAHVGLRDKFSTLAVEFRRDSVFATAGGEHELAAIVLNLQGRRIEGWVGDEGRRPVKDAYVFASGLEEPARTDDEGNFELTGLPALGKVWLVAMHATEPLFAAENVDPDWEYQPGLTLRPPVSATGRVVDENGRPIEGARLRGHPEFPISWTGERGSGAFSYPCDWENDLRQRLGQRGPLPFLHSETDADGKWHVEGLIPGAQYVFWVYELADGADVYRRCQFIADPHTTTDAGEIVVKF